MKTNNNKKYIFLFIFIVFVLGIYFIMSDELNKSLNWIYKSEHSRGGNNKEGICIRTMPNNND